MGDAMQAKRRKRRIRFDDVSWFDVHKYDPTFQWKAADWAKSLSLRRKLKVFSSFTHLPGAGQKLGPLLDRILDNPTGVSSSPATPYYLSDAPLVRDLTISDLFDSLERLEEDLFADVRTADKEWRSNYNAEEPIPEILEKGITDVIRERKPECIQFEMLQVDLGATNEHLYADFKSWLQEKRESLQQHSKKSITDSDLSDWARYRVLALIDLEIVCAFRNYEISNAVVGNLLFPEECNVDLSERVRKVVRPYADLLTNDYFLQSLAVHSIRTEQES